MASRKVGGIVAELMLQDKDFRSKMNRAGKLTQSKTAQMRKSFNQVAKRMAQVGAIAGGVLVAGLVKAGREMDAFAKRAQAARVVPEVFGGIAHWADRAGVKIGTVTNSLDKMNRRVSRSATGEGSKQVDLALAGLGLDAQELAKLKPEKQIDKVQEALKRMDDSNRAVALGQEILGKSSTDFIVQLRNTEESFQDATEWTEKYGTALSQIDLSQVEESNDAVADLKEISQGFWNQLRVAVSGPLTDTVQKIIDMTDEMGGMGEVADTAFNFMVKSGGVVGDVFWGWSLGILNAQANVMRLAGAIATLAAETGIFDKIADIATKADAMAVDEMAKKKARQELIEEGRIDKLSIFDSEKSRPQAQKDLIDERAQLKRKEIDEPQQFKPLISKELLEEIAASTEKGMEELLARMDSKIAQGPASDRFASFVNDSQERAEARAKKTAERIEKNQQTGSQMMVDSMDDTTEATDKLTAASKAAAKELDKLSVGDIAEHASGAPKKLAERIQAREEQRLKELASGRTEAAEKSRMAIAGMRDRLDLSQQGFSADEIRSGAAGKDLMAIAEGDPHGRTVAGREAISELVKQGKLDSPDALRGGDGAVLPERLEESQGFQGNVAPDVEPEVTTGRQVQRDDKSAAENPLFEIRDLMRAMMEKLAVATT